MNDKKRKDDDGLSDTRREQGQVRELPDADAPETTRRPVPGVKHEPEPDAGNIMPADDGPGTL